MRRQKKAGVLAKDMLTTVKLDFLIFCTREDTGHQKRPTKELGTN